MTSDRVKRALGAVFLAGALCLGAVAAAGPSPAWAEEKKDEAKDGKAAASDRELVAPNVVTPVVRNGKLVNYLFLTIQVDLNPKANASKVRERAHFLRDSLVRATHRNALGDASDDLKLNAQAAQPVVYAAAVEALGAENVAKVTIVGVDSLRRR